MSNTIYIESNRNVAVSQLDDDREIVPNKISNNHKSNESTASWTTTIDSGIMLQPGDEISLETASINVKGAGSNEKYMTFTGESTNILGDSSSKKDNETEIEVIYYVNNNCQFNFPAPTGTATRCDSDGGFFNSSMYGSPSLSGKNIWGVNFNTEAPVLTIVTPDFPGQRSIGTEPNHEYQTYNFYNQDYLMNKGYYFHQNIAPDQASGVTLGNFTVPGGIDYSSQPELKVNQCAVAGFLSWSNNIPIYGLPGVQFHQAVDGLDTVNKNITNKDNCTFVKDQEAIAGVRNDSGGDAQNDALTPIGNVSVEEQEAVQGGAAPYQIIPFGIQNLKCLKQSTGIDTTLAGQIQTTTIPSNPNAPTQFAISRSYNIEANAVALCQHGVFENSLAKVALNTMPKDLADYNEDRTLNNTFLPSPVYQDPMIIESARYKGGRETTNPNNTRLFCSDYTDSNKWNRGPYYNAYFNPCVKPDPTGSNQQISFRGVGKERDDRYFHFLKQKIKLELPTGNFSPERVAELLTDNLKELEGDADNPKQSIGITPCVFKIGSVYRPAVTPIESIVSMYQIDPIGDRNSLKEQTIQYNLTKVNSPSISSLSYKSYPTMNGLIWDSMMNSFNNFKKLDPGSDPDLADPNYYQYWSCNEPEVTALNRNMDGLGNEIGMGTNYNQFQAYDKIYKIMLCGNPFEWKAICKINPMLQATCFTLDDLITDATALTARGLYTGFRGKGQYAINTDLRIDQRNQFFQANVGFYGCQSVLLNDATDVEDNDTEVVKTRAYQCDWYLGTSKLEQVEYQGNCFDFYLEKSYTPENPNTPPREVNNKDEFNIMARSIRYNVYSDVGLFKYYKPQRMSMLVTNIIMGGGIPLSVFNDEYENLTKINIDNNKNSTGQNTLGSQSTKFYDNHYVEWVCGRIDDQYSYPETPSINIQKYRVYDDPQDENGGGIKEINGRKGSPRFLPNIFQTYKLFNYRPFAQATANAPNSTSQNRAMASLFVNKTNPTTNFNGNYGFFQEALGSINTNSGVAKYNEYSSPQATFQGNDADLPSFLGNDGTAVAFGRGLLNAKRVFGLPCWTSFASDFVTNDNEENNNNIESLGYQKGLRRAVKGFRYLPAEANDGTLINYWNPESAFLELIPLPTKLAQKFTTKPLTLGLDRLREIWKEITDLNQGKGMGVIPLFYKQAPVSPYDVTGDPTEAYTADELKLAQDIPFMAVILQEQDDKDKFPLFNEGESFCLGTSPSLSQNILSYPQSTQQTDLNTIGNIFGQNNVTQNGEQNLTDNYYNANVGVCDAFNKSQNKQPIVAAGDGGGQTPPLPPIQPDSEQQKQAIFLKTPFNNSPTPAECSAMGLASGGKATSTTINIGSADPVIKFLQEGNRFSIENLHTLASLGGKSVFQLAISDNNPNASNELLNLKSQMSAFSAQINLPLAYCEKKSDRRSFISPGDRYDPATQTFNNSPGFYAGPSVGDPTTTPPTPQPNPTGAAFYPARTDTHLSRPTQINSVKSGETLNQEASRRQFPQIQRYAWSTGATYQDSLGYGFADNNIYRLPFQLPENGGIIPAWTSGFGFDNTTRAAPGPSQKNFYLGVFPAGPCVMNPPSDQNLLLPPSNSYNITTIMAGANSPCATWFINPGREDLYCPGPMGKLRDNDTDTLEIFDAFPLNRFLITPATPPELPPYKPDELRSNALPPYPYNIKFQLKHCWVRTYQAQSIEGNVIATTYSKLSSTNTDIHSRAVCPDPQVKYDEKLLDDKYAPSLNPQNLNLPPVGFYVSREPLPKYYMTYRYVPLDKWGTDSIEPGSISRTGYFNPNQDLLFDPSGATGMTLEVKPVDGDTLQPELDGWSAYMNVRPQQGSGTSTALQLNCTHMSPFNMSQFKLRCMGREEVLKGTQNQTKTRGNGNYTELTQPLNQLVNLAPASVRPYAYIKQRPNPYAVTSAQSGISIDKVSLIKTDNTQTEINSLSYKLFEGTLLDKLGFNLNQILPIFSQIQTMLDPTKYNKFLGIDKDAYKQFANQVGPVTTNGNISTSNLPPLVAGRGFAGAEENRTNPSEVVEMVNLGQMNVPNSTSQVSAGIIGVKPPEFISYPYLVLYSNIISSCESQYIGGRSGKQSLPAVAPLQTNYASDDFVYVNNSNLRYTVTRQNVLTSLTSSIHFPNGRLADSILGENSALIYRIDKAQRNLDDFADQRSDRDDESDSD